MFKRDGVKQIVGGRVEEGVVRRGVKARTKRNKTIIGEGGVIQLQQNKQNVDEVAKGFEFGVMIESETPIEEGDVLEIFEAKVTKKTL